MKGIKVSSHAFQDGGVLLKKYSDWGENISPDLLIDEIPEGTCSLAIIMDDLDVPFVKEYNHWLIFNLPPITTIVENLSKLLYHADWLERQSVDYHGTIQGIAYGKHCYRGPKPPVFMKGAHRYVFTVYALDCFMQADQNIRKKEFLKLAEEHILGKGSIMGTYQN